MNGLASKTVTVDQATRIRLVRRIVFDDLTVQDTGEDFIERETICLGFFVGVVGDPNTIGTDSVNNGLDVHKITLPNGFCLPLSRDTPRLQRDG
jgi:hypothetical protein